MNTTTSTRIISNCFFSLIFFRKLSFRKSIVSVELDAITSEERVDIEAKKTTKAACYVSFAFGSVIMIIDMVAPKMLPEIMRSPINCGVIAMLLGLVIVPVVSLFTPKPEKELVESTFACYDKTTVVAQKTALGK